MKKRLALCYSGQPRYIIENFENHIKNIIEPNHNEFDIDVFGHFWKSSNSNSFDWQDFKGKQSGREEEFFKETMRAVRYQFEPQIQFKCDHLPMNPKYPHPVFNVVSMHYSLEKANDLKSTFENDNNFKYDCCVRIRTDLVFFHKVLFNKFDMSKLNIEQGNPNEKYSMGDLFAFGNSEVMDKFSTTYSNIEKYVQQGQLVSSDTILGYGLFEDDNRKVDIAYQNFGGWNLYGRF